MSANLLRVAAAAMRENANSAEPGRWKLWGMEVMADPKGTSDIDDAVDVAHAYTPSTADRRLHTGNAEHIASWDPVVALAVARWLETEADEQEELGSPTCPNVTPAGSRAHDLACAYLGRPE